MEPKGFSVDEVVEKTLRDGTFWDFKDPFPPVETYKFVFDRETAFTLLKLMAEGINKLPNYGITEGKMQEGQRQYYAVFGHRRRELGRKFGPLEFMKRVGQDITMGRGFFTDLESFARAYMVDSSSPESYKEEHGEVIKPKAGQFILVIENLNKNRFGKQFLDLMRTFYSAYQKTLSESYSKTPSETLQAR